MDSAATFDQQQKIVLMHNMHTDRLQAICLFIIIYCYIVICQFRLISTVYKGLQYMDWNA